jgi:glutamate synthase (NADPH/NADH) small chain
MGKPTGFMEFQRKSMPQRDPAERLKDWNEIYAPAKVDDLKQQGSRCMDCGVPFCQSDSGCPIDNLIPEWNDLVYQDRWHDAYDRLSKTNNFPEFTGRICPAPCEDACVLGITDPAVTIKTIEQAIIDRAFAEGWVKPNTPTTQTGKKVAIIGSGPAGLAAADQLNKVGHKVTVFERDDRVGGLLMYGVPNMKLDKGLVTRRVKLLAEAGIEFRTNCNVGVDITGEQLREQFDAVLLACGALKGRELDIPGRELAGVHMAMDYLTPATKKLLDGTAPEGFLDAKGKHVIVIGGGDTGADCIGTALRQGCKSLLNITRREREPEQRDAWHPWPGPKGTYYLDYSHAEGAARDGRDPREYQILPLEFVGDGSGKVKAIKIETLHWQQDGATGQQTSSRSGDVKELPADLVLLSIGFTGHDTPEIVKQLGVVESRGTIKANYGDFATNVEGVYVAGDMRRGASLIVWAIAEGRGAARAVDAALMGSSSLPAPNMTLANLPSSAG